MKVVFSLRHRLHHPHLEFEASRLQEPWEHPGRAERIQFALAADSSFEFTAPDEWGVDPILEVHDPGLVSFLETVWQRYQKMHGYLPEVMPDVFDVAAIREGMGPAPASSRVRMELGSWCYETTTPITHGTYDAARSSVDVALTAGDHVLNGDPVAYGLCRPPGHHAAHAVFGGYCFFNNAAIVANQLAAATGSKVAVLDVDYHHGNGTQQIFYGRDDVQYVSLHGDPVRAYPYLTGFADEVGSGAGRGATTNFPLREGTTDEEYLDVLAGACAEISSFGAEMVVVSLGLDTYFEDPISDFDLSPDGFEDCGAMVRELGLPTVVLQEGGYALDALGKNVRRWLTGVRPVPADLD